MFQACVSISVSLFSMFLMNNNVHRVCVCKWAYCWVTVKKKKKRPTYPIFQ